MRVEKLKAVRHGFAESCGSWEVHLLGLKTEGNSYIFGEYYLGPGMEKGAAERASATELLIDYIVNKCQEAPGED